MQNPDPEFSLGSYQHSGHNQCSHTRVDIPILLNIINYDFVDSSKIFMHRIGHTAHAGCHDWAYSLITSDELPYLLDLQLFLTRHLIIGSSQSPVNISYM